MLRIAGGTVHDPANGVDGEVRDLWIDGDRIVAAPTDGEIRPARTIDATGLVVMPGGIVHGLRQVRARYVRVVPSPPTGAAPVASADDGPTDDDADATTDETSVAP